MNPMLETTEMIDVGNGPHTFVCLHGWCCRTGDFAFQAEGLSDIGRIFVLDWQHRLASRGETCDCQAICDDIAQAITDAGIERPVLCGHSLGGFLAAQLAYQQTLPLAGLLILDSALPLPPKIRELWQQAARTLESQPWDEVFPGIESPFFTDDEAGALQDSIIRGMKQQSHPLAIDLLDEICTYPWADELATINVPTHLVASEYGWLNLEGLQAFVPHATAERIVDSGHFITVFHGDQVNTIMREFALHST
ncbi:MAG: alpha/beta hydrolase [Phycisphaerales bacterium]|nr:alpha/beta hydrolase [Phycisphaerales bacterium]